MLSGGTSATRRCEPAATRPVATALGRIAHDDTRAVAPGTLVPADLDELTRARTILPPGIALAPLAIGKTEPAKAGLGAPTASRIVAGRAVKHVLDIVVALLALVVLAPVLLLIAALVRLTSRGPALFTQVRVGRDGREFRMVKFRTMCVDAESRRADLLAANDADGVLFKMRSDPRVTALGRLLRRSSLDELPQLVNIVAGHMSLVGPRPPLPVEVAAYEGDVHRRLLVKPGLTGLWQVSGRSDLSWEDSVRLDLRYVENWSLSLDLLVLCKTARAVFRADGAY